MVGIVMVKKQTSSNWWWLDSHSNAKRSSWLQSTLSELDQKTEAMLKLIDEDADSFAKRAEMYYKKRPELINMVQDFYKAHRSLAERYDQIKSETPTRLLSTLGSPFSGEKSCQEKLPMTPITDRNYDSYSDTFEHDENMESEVDDPEEEGNKSNSHEPETPHTPVEKEHPHTTRMGKMAVFVNHVDEEVRKLGDEIERLRKENTTQREELEQKDEEMREVIRKLSMHVEQENPLTTRIVKTAIVANHVDEEVVRKLSEEIERLRKENMAQREQLEQKDEEKREVIRQLSMAVDHLKHENANLKRCANKENKKKDNSEVNKNNGVRGGFFRKLFNGSLLSSSQGTIVAL